MSRNDNTKTKFVVFAIRLLLFCQMQFNSLNVAGKKALAISYPVMYSGLISTGLRETEFRVPGQTRTAK